MIELPAATMVIIFPTIVATSVFELVYVNAPLLLVVGGRMAKGAIPTILGAIEKLIRTVVLGFTWMGAVTVIGPKLFVAGCVAVMIAVPAPTIVTTSFAILTTA
jgi:hypothetical protein